MKRLLVMISIPLLVGSVADSEEIDECGELVEVSAGCIQLHTFLSERVYELGNLAEFVAGDWVHVTGDIAPCDSACGPSVDGCVIDNEISRCRPDSLGCGVYREFPEIYCNFWTSPELGTFEVCAARPELTSGDTLAVWGMRRICVGFCMSGNPIIVIDSIAVCQDSLVPQSKHTWGRIKSLYRK
jgi:hypothetical protein